ncbi:MAG: hypothetical protein KDH88_06120 [Chromatiales bacterium]|nr:hypothetical protein [Chromatiales bacterium]
MKRRSILLSTVVLAWLAGMAAAFSWSLENRMRSFADGEQLLIYTDALNQEVSTDIASPENLATLIHYRDAACGCSLPNDEHVVRIAEKYARKSIRFVLVEASVDGSPWTVRVPWSKTLTPSTAGLPKVPSTPAAVVVDRHGRVAYFGPYSEGVGCFTGGGRFVEDTLEHLLAGEPVQRANLFASGCYCRSADG